jgi:hypothetical protein
MIAAVNRFNHGSESEVPHDFYGPLERSFG